MPRFIRDAPATGAGDSHEVFGGVVVQGNVAHALLVVRDTDPPSVLRQVRIEALVDDVWMPCELVGVSGGGGSDGVSTVVVSWRANPDASQYACTV